MDDDSTADEETLSVTHPAASDVSLPPREVLSLDYVYDALGHPRRRYLCYTLLEDTEWTLEELATKVAAWERDVPEQEVPPTSYEKAYASLYHAHVPKLVDDDIVTFEECTETIRPGPHAEQVLSALLGMGASVDANQEEHARSDMTDE
ncbi:DUF7344 domain-containing protein [Haloarcula marina]|uniref:DUF7344 domain-containing protein n=1 Tax=Haloarcula marina TaxID=2961574 RepID=UPI0020B6C6B2|nr:hypothetical protein [Halomicroarcula marina]